MNNRAPCRATPVVLVANGHNRHAPDTFETTVDAFCQELSLVNSQAVQDAVKKIAGLRRQIVINMLAIGDRLNKLRAGIGPEKFYRFMSDVLPTLGISRSTGYRWLDSAEKLATLFPNPLVRHYLMTLTDGKGIIASGENEGKRDAQVVLTAAAAAALKVLPPAPKVKEDHVESERWVRQFIKAMGKARSEARSPQRNSAKERAGMIKHFKRFAARYGLRAAEDLCGHMDKVLSQMAEESEGEPPQRRPRFEGPPRP